MKYYRVCVAHREIVVHPISPVRSKSRQYIILATPSFLASNHTGEAPLNPEPEKRHSLFMGLGSPKKSGSLSEVSRTAAG